MKIKDTPIPVKREISQKKLTGIECALGSMVEEKRSAGDITCDMAQDLLGIIEYQRWIKSFLETKGVTIGTLRKILSIELPNKKPGTDDPSPVPAEQNKESPEVSAKTDQDVSLQSQEEAAADPQGAEQNKPAGSTKPRKNNNENHPGKRGASAFAKAPVIVHSHDALKIGDSCQVLGCAGKLYPLRSEESRREVVLVVAAPPLHVEIHQFIDLRCNICGKLYHAHMDHSHIAGHEDGRGIKFTQSAQVMIAFLHVWSGIPYHRLAQTMGIFQLDLSPSLIFSQIAAVAEKLAPFIQYLESAAGDACRLYTDDFSVNIRDENPVLRENRKDGTITFREGFYTSVVVAILQGGNSLPIFSSGLKHAGENLDRIFVDRAVGLPPPIIISDASAVNKTYGIEALTSGCLQHARKRFVEALKYDRERAEQILTLLTEAFSVDRATHELLPEDRLTVLCTKALPFILGAHTLCLEWQEGKVTPPKGPLGKAINYFLEYYEQLTVAFRIPGIALTNNISEWSFFLSYRRKINSYFFNTFRGVQVFDAIHTILMLAALNHKNPWQYLSHLYENADKSRKNWANLLPWKIDSSVVGVFKGTCEEHWIPAFA
jgi:hypothetical protein